MKSAQVKYPEYLPGKTTIALHILVTVRRVFPDGPGKTRTDTRVPFGGVPFFSRRLSGLAGRY